VKKGFTIIELLIVITLISLMLSYIAPVSYSIVKKYWAQEKALKFARFLYDVRLKSFLYRESYEITTENGYILVNGKKYDKLYDCFAFTDKKIVFYENGTSSDGVVNLICDNVNFSVKVEKPYGRVILQ
jgi:prepilin-type N-terminal cleavage/methylation domain-containing protein